MLYSIRAALLFPILFLSTLFTWMKNCPLFISPTFSDLGSADAFCQAFLLSVKNQGISLPSFMPRDNTIQGYHSKGQRGHGEKAATKLERILVARELEWGCAWMGRLNVRHSLLGLEDHLKEGWKCKSNHTWEGRPVQCQNNIHLYMSFGLFLFKILTVEHVRQYSQIISVIFSDVHLLRQFSRKMCQYHEDRKRQAGKITD